MHCFASVTRPKFRLDINSYLEKYLLVISPSEYMLFFKRKSRWAHINVKLLHSNLRELYTPPPLSYGLRLKKHCDVIPYLNCWDPTSWGSISHASHLSLNFCFHMVSLTKALNGIDRNLAYPLQFNTG